MHKAPTTAVAEAVAREQDPDNDDDDDDDVDGQSKEKKKNSLSVCLSVLLCRASLRSLSLSLSFSSVHCIITNTTLQFLSSSSSCHEYFPVCFCHPSKELIKPSPLWCLDRLQIISLDDRLK